MDFALHPKRKRNDAEEKVADVGAQVAVDGDHLNDFSVDLKRIRQRTKVTEKQANITTRDNLQMYLDLEAQKFLLDHAEDYQLSNRETSTLQKKIYTKTIGRKHRLERDPVYQFCIRIAGMLGERVESVLESGPEVEAAEVSTQLQALNGAPTSKNTFDEYAKRRLDDRPAHIDTNTYEHLLLDPEASGRIQMKGFVYQAVQIVEEDLSDMRGCERLPSIMDLVHKNDKHLMNRLASVVGYQIMTLRQLDKKRSYLDGDYAKIMRQYQNGLMSLIVYMRRKNYVGKHVLSKARFTSSALCDF